MAFGGGGFGGGGFGSSNVPQSPFGQAPASPFGGGGSSGGFGANQGSGSGGLFSQPSSGIGGFGQQQQTGGGGMGGFGQPQQTASPGTSECCCFARRVFFDSFDSFFPFEFDSIRFLFAFFSLSRFHRERCFLARFVVKTTITDDHLVCSFGYAH